MVKKKKSKEKGFAGFLLFPKDTMSGDFFSIVAEPSTAGEVFSRSARIERCSVRSRRRKVTPTKSKVTWQPIKVVQRGQCRSN